MIRNPTGGFADFVVDPGLLLDRAAESGGSNANQSPFSVEVYHERTSGIAEASIMFPALVPGAKHLVVKLNGDRLIPMPSSAPTVLNDWNQDLMEQVCPGLAERVVRLAPAGDHPDLP